MPTRGWPGDFPGASGWRRAAAAVFRKEMSETVRDRRTLMAAVVLPALTMPLVVLAIPSLAQRQQETLRQQPARVALKGGDAGGLVALGSQEGYLRLVASQDPRGALARGDVDAVLVDPGPGPGGPRVITVLYDETRPSSRAALQKVGQVAARLALRDLRSAARLRGVDPDRLIAVAVEPQNVAPPHKMGGALLAVALPFFLVVWLLLGGQYAALDVGVGERERGSLDTILASPAPRSAVVAGKFLAVAVPALLALGVMLVSAAAAVAAGGRLLAGGAQSAVLPAQALLPLILVGAALGGLLSASQVAVSLAATSLREAQQAFAGLYLVVAFPVIVLPFLEGAAARPWMALVPVLNAALAVRGVLLAEASTFQIAATAASLLALTPPVLLLGVRLLDAQGRRIR